MTRNQNDALISAIRAIAHGPESGPSGLELVAVALAGKDKDVATALTDIAHAINRLADSVQDVYGTIRVEHHQPTPPKDPLMMTAEELRAWEEGL